MARQNSTWIPVTWQLLKLTEFWGLKVLVSLFSRVLELYPPLPSKFKIFGFLNTKVAQLFLHKILEYWKKQPFLVEGQENEWKEGVVFSNRFLICLFRGLTNLVDLDLSGNALASVPTSAVEDCKYLMRLDLRSNPIPSVGSEAFSGLSELVHLDLSHCGLEEVHPLAFRGLNNLEYLRLEANRLTTLSPTTQSFPPNLR